ncbi:NAD(P)H-dependent glycerol-3-phosphate dehydrogenase [Shouchella sp. 1P09AA]|uniref:NAD(P)H-dependent glycerol-3-phosphate dehydrogenase n=1 Tax=unclassified Shouchella TaxID=2893065 RepID=UPI0039A2BC34
MKQTIAVVGAGSWGTALAIVLADNGHDVRLVARRQEQVEEMNEYHTNEKYLRNVQLPKQLRAYLQMKDAVKGVDAVLLAVPSKAMRETVQELVAVLEKAVPVIHASKGIEPSTYKRVSEVIEEEAGDSEKIASITVISGPSHAEEVALRQPTTVTVASHIEDAAAYAQGLFMNPQFRVYTNPDLIGVEIGGALKNIIALICGVTNGLGYGDNTKAAIMTRGLTEIARLGVHMGAQPLTFSGLTGLGDLIVTCTSVHSRNWRAGHMLGKGMSMDQVLEEMGMVVEGIRTTQAAYELASKEDINMPLTAALYSVLFKGVDPVKAAEDLMGRVKRNEVEELYHLN